MIERDELTQEINNFYKGREVPNGIRYTQGHTIICSEQFIAANLRVVNSDSQMKFWKLAFLRLNDLRIALVDKTYEVVEVKEKIIFLPPNPTVKLPDKKIEKVQVQREPLVLDLPVKKPEIKKNVDPAIQKPTLF